MIALVGCSGGGAASSDASVIHRTVGRGLDGAIDRAVGSGQRGAVRGCKRRTERRPELRFPSTGQGTRGPPARRAVRREDDQGQLRWRHVRGGTPIRPSSPSSMRWARPPTTSASRSPATRRARASAPPGSSGSRAPTRRSSRRSSSRRPRPKATTYTETSLGGQGRLHEHATRRRLCLRVLQGRRADLRQRRERRGRRVDPGAAALIGR